METKEPAMTATHDYESGAVVIGFPRIGKSITVRIADCNEEAKLIMPYHGLEQKLRDKAALGYRNVDGRQVRPTDEEKYAAVLAQAAQLLDPNEGWNARREAGGGEGLLLFSAIRAAFPDRFTTVDQFRAWVKEQAAVQAVSEAHVRTALSVMPKISREMEKLRKERGKMTKVDAGKLEAGLENLVKKG